MGPQIRNRCAAKKSANVRRVKITGERKNNFTVYGPDNAHAQFGLTAEQTRDEIFKLLEQNGISITDQHKDGMNIKIKID